MNDYTLERGKVIKSQMKEIKNFLNVFDSSLVKYQSRFYKFFKDCGIKVTTKETKEYNIFGYQYRLSGQYSTNLDIPTELIEPLEKVFKEKLKELETEYENL